MDQPLTDVDEYIGYGTPPGADQDCDFLQALVGLDGSRSAKLLDLACGVGRHALRMAQRGFTVIGVDFSEERIQYATAEANRLALTNCQFVVGDLRVLHLDTTFDYAYSFFNTFSCFVDNNELPGILQGVRNCLVPRGRLVIQVGSLWGSIADGKFKNDSYEQTSERGGLTRKVSGTLRIARTNNIYQHNRVIQYIKDGVEYPPKESKGTQRMFSINEWDLLCRLTGFEVESKYSRMDINSKLEKDEVYENASNDSELIVVLRRREG